MQIKTVLASLSLFAFTLAECKTSSDLAKLFAKTTPVLVPSFVATINFDGPLLMKLGKIPGPGGFRYVQSVFPNSTVAGPDLSGQIYGGSEIGVFQNNGTVQAYPQVTIYGLTHDNVGWIATIGGVEDRDTDNTVPANLDIGGKYAELAATNFICGLSRAGFVVTAVCYRVEKHGYKA